MTTRTPSRLLPLAALLLAACAAAPPELVREGERLLAAGDHAGAARTFDQVLRDSRATALDRTKAQVGEARAYLLKGDLVGARTRLRRIEDAVSDKWYLLGVIAVREGDAAEAVTCLRGALERAHGGDTATLLARAIAGEARGPDVFEEAAGLIEQRGGAPLAEALRGAAAVWRDVVAGADAPAALARLTAVSASLGDYPAVRVLEARLLDRAGKPAEAAARWDLTTLAPPPSAGFRAWASELRARLALEAGDAAGLDAALAGADPATAARLHADVARARARRADPRGALDAWRRAAATTGAPAAVVAEALAEAALLEDALGLPSAQDAWSRAEAKSSASPAARLRLALRRGALGDPIGGAALAGEPAVAALDSPRARDLRRAGALVDGALRALEAGRDDEARCLARAARQLDPGGPTGRALDEALGALTLAERTRALQAGRGSTRAAFDRAGLRLHLAVGDVSGVAALLDRPDAPASLEDLDAALEAGLLRALDEGHLPETIRLLERHRQRLAAATLARLRAGAPFRPLPDAVLAPPRGPSALPAGDAVGALVVPGSGLRFPRVLLGLGERQRALTLTLPDGTRVEATPAELAQLLGEPLDACLWTGEPGAGAREFEQGAGRARGEAAPATPILGVR
jgi:hypothetical protein